MKMRDYFDYAEDGISIEFPDLPGCISCGYSYDEAVFMAKDVLRIFVKYMLDEGMPLPTPSIMGHFKNNDTTKQLVLIDVVL